MRRALILLSVPAMLAQGQTPDAAKTEVKVGLGIEKYELTGAASDFKLAPDTKLYAWARIAGITDGTATIVFVKDGKAVSKQDLKVPHSPYRTHAYRTFRAGDGGAWTVKVVGADGAELASASFTVAMEAGEAK